MSGELSAALRFAGWRADRNTLHHALGGVVRQREGVITATRADGTKRYRVASLAEAIAWVTGDHDAPADEQPRRHRASGTAAGVPAGWTGGRGLYRHARGTIETGHVPGKFRAELANGVREMFKLRDDAVLWVEGGGTFPAGHVRAERRGA